VKLNKGKNKIKAISNGLVDNSVIVKVAEEHKGYSFEGGEAGVTNWFGADGQEINMTFNRDYFSIKDKIKEIMAHPEGKVFMEAMMEKMVGSMGGEVSGFKVTPGMMKMMQSFTLERISKMAGDKIPAELIAEINVELQKIKK
jgi:hypothetical protein